MTQATSTKRSGTQAKDKAQEAAGQAKGRVREQVDQRSTQAGEQVTSTAQDVRAVSDELRKQGKDKPAQLADQAAERAERLGSYLKESDADRILSDIEDFGRKQPWAIVAGGVALGFLGSRFLKASSRQRYQATTARPTLPQGM
jgi:broad specificity phosphatase PhoE